jgi:hypothetical protein
VTAPPHWKPIEYRWRRTGKPGYRCEIEFRNPGSVRRDFKYEISYQYNAAIETYGRKKAAGALTGVGAASELITIPVCYYIDPSVGVRASGTIASTEDWKRSFSFTDDRYGCRFTISHRQAASTLTELEQASPPCSGDYLTIVNLSQIASVSLAGNDKKTVYRVKLVCIGTETEKCITNSGGAVGPLHFHDSDLRFPSESAAEQAVMAIRAAYGVK